jgi:putative flippase GtrA
MSVRVFRAGRRVVVVPTYDEMLRFLTVGGVGYVVDVLAFNVFLSIEPFSTSDPAYARTLAVAVAMAVTYTGHRTFTWRHVSGEVRRREVGLFVLFSVIGFGFSLGALIVSHDILGYTSRLADNISANVIGLALGTAFRFWAYRRFVFRVDGGLVERRVGVRLRDHQLDSRLES